MRLETEIRSVLQWPFFRILIFINLVHIIYCAYKLAESEGYVAFYGTINGTVLDTTFVIRKDCLDFCTEDKTCAGLSFAQGPSWQMIDCTKYSNVTGVQSDKDTLTASYVKKEFVKDAEGNIEPDLEIKPFKFKEHDEL